MTKLGSRKLHICPRVTEMGSIIGHTIDYNGVGALTGKRHISRNKFRNTRLLDITRVTVPFFEGRYTFNWVIEDLDKLG